MVIDRLRPSTSNLAAWRLLLMDAFQEHKNMLSIAAYCCQLLCEFVCLGVVV